MSAQRHNGDDDCVEFLPTHAEDSPELTELINSASEIIRTVFPLDKRSIPGYTLDEDRFSLNLDCDEVYPNIFLSDGVTAKNLNYLKKVGISHVINTAKGTVFKYGMVNTSNGFYKDVGIKFLGFEIIDLPHINVSCYFRDAADYIEEALESNGKVLVHCYKGLSRSSTIVLAFLIIKKKMSLLEALKQVRQKREILPNDGFVRQLAYLDLHLRKGYDSY